MLSCLTKPTSGDAFIEGNSIVKDTAKVKKIIGVSPQETAVAPNLSVKENLELMCGVHGFSKEKKRDKVKKLSGVWFDLDLVGGVFKKIANVLPFVHGVELERAVLGGNYEGVFQHLCWVVGYMAVMIVIAVCFFVRQMKRQ